MREKTHYTLENIFEHILFRNIYLWIFSLDGHRRADSWSLEERGSACVEKLWGGRRVVQQSEPLVLHLPQSLSRPLFFHENRLPKAIIRKMGQKKVGEEGRSDYGVPLVREEGTKRSRGGGVWGGGRTYLRKIVWVMPKTFEILNPCKRGKIRLCSKPYTNVQELCTEYS